MAGPRAETVKDLIDRLLDRGYTQAAGQVIAAIAGNSSKGVMAKRLAELDAEVARLEAAGEKLSPDSAVVRALLADFNDVMRANQALINNVADVVQQSGVDAAGPVVRQLALPGLSDEALRVIGLTWNRPNPDAVAALVDYVNQDVWAARLKRYGDGVPDVVKASAVRGFVEGWGPRRLSANIQQQVELLPTHYADTLLRTLQLTSFRDGQVVHRVANSHILEYQIRIAALDDRTCITCVALHGTILSLDERVDDHHAGRCTSVTKVKTLPAPAVTDGATWFGGLNEAQQRQQMGHAAYEAWRAGAITLQEFVRPYQDDVFGRMVGVQSLSGMLGDAAQEYYEKAG